MTLVLIEEKELQTCGSLAIFLLIFPAGQEISNGNGESVEKVDLVTLRYSLDCDLSCVCYF